MNKRGFLGIINLIIIILVIVGAVVSYNFFKDGFVESEIEDVEKSSEEIDGESEEIDDIVNGDSELNEDLEIE